MNKRILASILPILLVISSSTANPLVVGALAEEAALTAGVVGAAAGTADIFERLVNWFKAHGKTEESAKELAQEVVANPTLLSRFQKFGSPFVDFAKEHAGTVSDATIAAVLAYGAARFVNPERKKTRQAIQVLAPVATGVSVVAFEKQKGLGSLSGPAASTLVKKARSVAGSIVSREKFASAMTLSNLGLAADATVSGLATQLAVKKAFPIDNKYVQVGVVAAGASVPVAVQKGLGWTSVSEWLVRNAGVLSGRSWEAIREHPYITTGTASVAALAAYVYFLNLKKRNNNDDSAAVVPVASAASVGAGGDDQSASSSRIRRVYDSVVNGVSGIMSDGDEEQIKRYLTRLVTDVDNGEYTVQGHYNPRAYFTSDTGSDRDATMHPLMFVNSVCLSGLKLLDVSSDKIKIHDEVNRAVLKNYLLAAAKWNVCVWAAGPSKDVYPGYSATIDGEIRQAYADYTRERKNFIDAFGLDILREQQQVVTA